MDRSFACWTFVFIRGFVINKVPLVEPAFGLAVRREWLGNQRNDAYLLARQDFRRVEVAPICQRRHAFGAKGFPGLRHHARELCAVVTFVRHVMGNNQMMLGVDCRLNVVANRARATTT